MSREAKIIRTSIIGIIVNIILAIFKAMIGLLTNSIAITLDAINNFTDAFSSIVTIIGTKLANRPPDKDHPYGYGRIEYFSSIINVALVLSAGVTALIESWPKIFHPDVTNYTFVPLLIIAVAVVVKFSLGVYVKRVGEDINSQALVASGSDAYFDAILSLSTLAAAIISIFFHISLEGILGVIISIQIIRASLEMLKETLDSMIGVRIDAELSHKIKDTIYEFPQVLGAYDLILHNYGPDRMQGSVHIEVDENMTAKEIHQLTRQIAIKIVEKFSIFLSVGIYSRNSKYNNIRNDLYEIASKYEEILEIHGFIVNEEQNLITFDIIVDFDADREKVKKEILSQIKEKHPEFNYYMIDDYDVSD